MTSYLEVANSSASDDWPTPSWVVRQAAKEFARDGVHFDLDPATNPSNPVDALGHYTPEDDGLSKPWHGRVWLNPPYGRTIGQWMAKARDEVAYARAELVVCLVPVRVDARWWQTNVVHARPAPLLRFWPKRLRYVKDWDAPFASATVVYGYEATGRLHGMVAKECPVCKVERPGEEIFWPTRSNAITCSARCRDRRYRYPSKYPTTASRL